MRTGEKIRATELKIVNGFLYLGLLSIVAMMMLGASEVILSVLINFRIPGAKEALALLMSIAVFSFLPYAFHHRQMVAIDVLASFYTGKLKRIYEIVCSIIGLVIFVPITLLTFPAAWHSLDILEYTGGSLAVPIYPARIIISLSSCFLCIQLLFAIVKTFREKESPP